MPVVGGGTCVDNVLEAVESVVLIGRQLVLWIGAGELDESVGCGLFGVLDAAALAP